MAVTSLLSKIILFALTTYAENCFNSIIGFGDSLTDTGNGFHFVSAYNPPPYFTLSPYGDTFFDRPTGRLSDGRLIIDFIDYKRYLQTSLVLLGEIGGNDYNHAFLQGKTEAEVQPFVPKIVKTIGETINELINLGAVTLVVPGNFPIGCSATYLTHFASTNEEDYDSTTGCIKWLNRFAQYHNDLLQTELSRIRELHPETTIIYGDYYNAAMNMYRSPEIYGFTGGALKACCGGGGLYNFNFTVQCGHPSSVRCVDPSSYMNWDGMHFTEVAAKWIAKSVLTHVGTICDRPSSHAGVYDH
ncbi:hypothetical protein RD792_017149 [Penstemon davidsonii]|uniref:Uncharacterized protein n=1 Tax=Penstemon davidsonii TaxID=160366 RepID=A0ABR0CM56_9LAMI|nr:hypothetical protein RD792_017149 [Penstemon davidsonii]